MANGTVSWNEEQAIKTLANLKEYAPTEGELSSIFSDAHEELTMISNKHDNFLAKYLGELITGGDLYNKYNLGNYKYNLLIDNISKDVTDLGGADDEEKASEIYYPYYGGGRNTSPSTSDEEEIKVEIVDWEKPTDSGSFATPDGSPKKPIKDPTNPFEKPTEAPTEIPTEIPTEKPTEIPTEIPTEKPTEIPTEKPTTIPPIERPTEGPKPTVPVSKPSTGGNTTGGGWYRGSSNTNPPTQAPTEAPKVAQDVITRGNTYKLPTSTKISPTTAPQSKGNSVIPVLAGLGAAAAAGIGAKAYIDKKNNSDNEENEEFKAEDWSDNTDVNIEYNEPTSQQEETLDFDDDGYGLEEPEKYGARTHEELEDLQ